MTIELSNKYLGYDLESYPNIFTCCIGDPVTHSYNVYEISERKNEFNLLLRALATIRQHGVYMVGFNNIAYDYPMLHYLLTNATPETSKMHGAELAAMMRVKNDEIFSRAYGAPSGIWENEVMLRQLDLSKINHFDNANRRTSLKCLEFKMRSTSIQDLPYDPSQPLTVDQMDGLVQYNIKDVRETLAFFEHCKPAIRMREQMSESMGMDVTNYNDTKIGAKFFQLRLERELGPEICYTKKGRRTVANQTKRTEMALADILDPRIQFSMPEFQAIHAWLRNQVITQTKGAFSDLNLLDQSTAGLHPYIDRIQEMLVEISKNKKGTKKITRRTQVVHLPTGEILYTFAGNGSKDKLKKIRSEYPDNELEFQLIKHTLPKLCVPFSNAGSVPGATSRLGDLLVVYGTGGIHASIENKAVHSDNEWVIIDADVTSYYPSLFLSTRAYPEHLTEHFTPIYKSLIDERLQHPKGSTENKALKLALNGVYGKTNDAYSPFYDPLCMLKITLNGQMFLTMLIEKLKLNLGANVELIQANTDGITCLVHRSVGAQFAQLCNEWCNQVELKLEYAAYDHMYIKDVNNYMAITQAGKIKAVGKYADPVPTEENYKGDWAKDHSQLVVYKVAQAKLLNPDLDVVEAVRNHPDIFDFMFYVKASGKTLIRMEMHYTAEGFDEPHEIQRRSRFIVTTEGGRLYSVLHPTSAAPDKVRHVGMKAGQLVTLCNDVDEVFLSRVREIIDYDYYVDEVMKLLNLTEV